MAKDRDKSKGIRAKLAQKRAQHMRNILLARRLNLQLPLPTSETSSACPQKEMLSLTPPSTPPYTPPYTPPSTPPYTPPYTPQSTPPYTPQSTPLRTPPSPPSSPILQLKRSTKHYGRNRRNQSPDYNFVDTFTAGPVGQLIIDYASPTTRRENITFTPTNKKQKKLPDGRRFFTMQSIEDAMNKAAHHRDNCTDAQFDIVKENRNGLTSKFKVQCRVCSQIPFEIYNDEGKKTLPINEATHWATYAAAISFTAIETVCSIFEVPFFSRNSYSKIESTSFHDTLQGGLMKMLIENGKEEFQLARSLGQVENIKVGDVMQEVAYTDVFGDGQWSKRCYNQTGTANSGAAVIIGILSKKILFLGVRNKFCYICATSQNKAMPSPTHNCFLNWTGSSSSMETDIIKEGFEKSVEMHNLIYKRFIGDGDSSVYNSIRTAYLNKETNFLSVEKVECKNHAVRRMNFNLYAILKPTTINYQLRRLLEQRIGIFGRSIQYLIEHHQGNIPASSATALKKDILNIPSHAFGEHRNCKIYYCDPLTKKLVVPDKFKAKDKKIATPVAKPRPNIFNKIRKTNIWPCILKPIERIANLSVSLMYNVTTNIAENFMSQINKALGGRRIHVSNRGGYNRRMATSALSAQYGRGWASQLFRRTYKMSPGDRWKNLENAGLKDRMRKQKPRSRKKLKYPEEAKVEFQTKRPLRGDSDYGQHSKDIDMPDLTVQNKTKDFLDEWKCDKNRQNEIERNTVDQYYNEEYKTMKLHTITASIAHRIYKLRTSTANVSILDDILVPNELSNIEAVCHGTRFEETARNLYNSTRTAKAEKCGLFLSLECGILGASPDGIVKADGVTELQDGIIEIKCPFKEKDGNPADVAKRDKDIFLVVRPQGQRPKGTSKYMLNRKHKYYHQVVMQLHVTEKFWCDFIVYTAKGILVDRIERNAETLELWEKMKPKLIKFFIEDLAPEIVNSRRDRGMGYRQPPERLKAYKTEQQKRSETQARKTATALSTKPIKKSSVMATKNVSQVRNIVQNAKRVLKPLNSPSKEKRIRKPVLRLEYSKL